MNDNKKLPSDEFCDAVLAAMHKRGDGTFADREIVDKVMRPFYKMLDEAYERGESTENFCSAIESAVTMMISNFVRRIVMDNNFEQKQDVTQEIITNIALRLNDDLVAQHAAIQQTAEIITLPTHPKDRRH